MNNVNVSKVVEKVLSLEEGAVTEVRPAGGMTNINYTFNAGGERFIVRLPGIGTDELVDREAERDNLLFATGLGINPELVYNDVETGMKISREIHETTTLTDELARQPWVMHMVVEVLSTLHQAPYPMKNRFELRKLITHYESLVEGVNPTLFKKYGAMQGSIDHLLADYEALNIKEVPCHIDAGCFNFILSGTDNLYLVDWEYSGMFDPLWDVAAFMQASDFNAEEEDMFLHIYFGRDSRHEEKQRVLMHKIFQDYLWSLWAAYKEALGANHGTYAQDRFERGAWHFPNTVEDGA